MSDLMKRLKSSLVVHIGFLLYLTGGSAIYFQLENPARKSQAPSPIQIDATFCELLIEMVTATSRSAAHVTLRSDVLKEVEEACYNLTGIRESTSGSDEGNVSWEYSSALFFSMTVLTTIGYGSFAPLTDGGKIFCIIYGFFGIPFCGLLLANTSDYFSSILLRIYERRYKENHKWTSILVAATTFLIPGLALFLFVPAAIFTYLEEWNYLDAIYFSFVTLTTIGFGDIVVAQSGHYSWLWLYRLSWVIWVYLGIAYWAIIIHFVSKALKSGKLRKQLKLISEHAHHIGRPSDAFVASKTKMAMGFALQMAGSFGDVDPQTQHRLASVPGIAAALKPKEGPGKGLLALMQLATVLGKESQPAENVEREPQNHNVCSNECPDEQPGNGCNIGQTPGSDSKISYCPINTENAELAQSSDRSFDIQRRLQKTDRYLSLPANLHAEDSTDKTKEKLGSYSMTQSELRTLFPRRTDSSN